MIICFFIFNVVVPLVENRIYLVPFSTRERFKNNENSKPMITSRKYIFYLPVVFLWKLFWLQYVWLSFRRSHRHWVWRHVIITSAHILYVCVLRQDGGQPDLVYPVHQYLCIMKHIICQAHRILYIKSMVKLLNRFYLFTWWRCLVALIDKPQKFINKKWW